MRVVTPSHQTLHTVHHLGSVVHTRSITGHLAIIHLAAKPLWNRHVCRSSGQIVIPPCSSLTCSQWPPRTGHHCHRRRESPYATNLHVEGNATALPSHCMTSLARYNSQTSDNNHHCWAFFGDFHSQPAPLSAIPYHPVHSPHGHQEFLVEPLLNSLLGPPNVASKHPSIPHTQPRSMWREEAWRTRVRAWGHMCINHGTHIWVTCNIIITKCGPCMLLIIFGTRRTQRTTIKGNFDR